MAKKPPIVSNQQRLLRLRSTTDIKEFLQTMAIVVPLTILIWIYAERAQTADEKNLQIKIEVASLDATSTAAHIVEPSIAPTVVLDIRGPRKSLNDVRDEIDRRASAGNFVIKLPNVYAAGTQQSLDLTSLLNNIPLFKDRGVTVTKSSIPTITVEFEGYIDRDARVVLPRDFPIQVTNAVFDPPTVKVRGPASLLAHTLDLGNPQIEANFAPLMSQVAIPGPHKFDSVELRRFPGITTDRNSVAVSFTAGQREEEFKIPAITIAVQRPLVEDGKYRVELKQVKVIQNLKVKGTKDALAPLTDPNNPRLPTAVLRVSQADLNKDNLHRRVEISDLPPGVVLVDPPPEIDFAVTPATDTP